jgi:hypothetical protein
VALTLASLMMGLALVHAAKAQEAGGAAVMAGTSPAMTVV